MAQHQGRSEKFLAEILKEEKAISYVVVNEAGHRYILHLNLAQRIPNLDVTFRGAVSIGRRLQDPLAELVKIDPRLWVLANTSMM